MTDDTEYTIKLKAFAELTNIDVAITVRNKEDLELAIDLGYELIDSYCDKKKAILNQRYTQQMNELRRMLK